MPTAWSRDRAAGQARAETLARVEVISVTPRARAGAGVLTCERERDAGRVPSGEAVEPASPRASPSGPVDAEQLVAVRAGAAAPRRATPARSRGCAAPSSAGQPADVGQKRARRDGAVRDARRWRVPGRSAGACARRRSRRRREQLHVAGDRLDRRRLVSGAERRGELRGRSAAGPRSAARAPGRTGAARRPSARARSSPRRCGSTCCSCTTTAGCCAGTARGWTSCRRCRAAGRTGPHLRAAPR